MEKPTFADVKNALITDDNTTFKRKMEAIKLPPEDEVMKAHRTLFYRKMDELGKRFKADVANELGCDESEICVVGAAVYKYNGEVFEKIGDLKTDWENKVETNSYSIIQTFIPLVK